MNEIVNIENIQVLFPSPLDEPNKFEEFIAHYFNELYETNSFFLFGKLGQKQYGLDIYSTKKKIVIQCKLKDISLSDDKNRKSLIEQLRTDFDSFSKYNLLKANKFNQFIYVSSYRSDNKLDDEAIDLSTENINVQYWSWSTLVANMPKKTLDKYYHYINSENYKYYLSDFTMPIDLSGSKINKNNLGVTIDSTQHILKQLGQLLDSKVYKESNFIPPHLLEKYSPFQISRNSYYYNFTLTTDNKLLFELFKGFRIENNNEIIFTNPNYFKGVYNYKKKLIKVLESLNSNLITSINYKHETIDIKLVRNELCECLICELNNSNKTKSFKQLKTKEKDLTALMDVAYRNYKIGNFKTSADYFFKAKEIATLNKNHFVTYLIEYNLSKLYNYVKYNSYKVKYDDEFLRRLKSINLESIFCKYKNIISAPIISWVHNGNFYNIARNNISKNKNKIIESYYNSKKGGSSSNNYVFLLFNEMAKIDFFIQRNHIIYDHFVEYTELVSMFTEGMFASLATKEHSHTKINHLNNWTLHILINYSNPTNLIKLINRYELKEVEFEILSSKNENIIDYISNLIGNFHKNATQSKKYLEQENDRFSQREIKKIRNAIILSGISNFDDITLNKIASKINQFIEKYGIYQDMDYVSFFYARKKTSLKILTLKKAILSGVSNARLHSQFYFEPFTNYVSSQNLKISMTGKEFDSILKAFYFKCDFCNEVHEPTYLIYLHRVLASNDMRNTIKQSVLDSIDIKFHFESFGLAVIFDVINLNNTLLDKAIHKIIAEINPNPKAQKFQSFNHGVDENKRNYKLDFLFNICLKEKVDLAQDKFDVFKGISHYYDWLLDMDNFNYSLFKCEWITLYGTKYYFEKMSKSDKLKKHLETFIKDEQSYSEQKIMNDYINIYIRKSWDF